MSPPAANTRSRSATPNNTPAKAHAGRSSNPPASVGKLLSALTLRGSSPESENGQQTATSLLRVNLFAFLGANPKAHEDDQLRAEFSSLLEEYTKAERAVSSDPLFCIGRNYFGMKEYKLVLIGGASVGKSAYVEKLKSNRFISKYEPTDKVEVTSLVLNTNHYPIKIDFWDTAGSEKHAGMRDGYFVGADAAMLMYDVSSKPASTKELTDRYTNFVRVCAGVPMVLAGNKAESSSKRKVQQKDVIATFRRRNKLQVSTRLTSLRLLTCYFVCTSLIH
jgi:small GTP-binding protein